jgi:hypothetical protein
MAGHLLGVLEPSVVFQVDRDTGCPPGVTSDGGEKSRSLGPFSNCSPGIVLRSFAGVSLVSSQPGAGRELGDSSHREMYCQLGRNRKPPLYPFGKRTIRWRFEPGVGSGKKRPAANNRLLSPPNCNLQNAEMTRRCDEWNYPAMRISSTSSATGASIINSRSSPDAYLKADPISGEVRRRKWHTNDSYSRESPYG